MSEIKPTNKKYEINTIEDILAVVNEDNIKGFLIDFITWLHAMIKLKKGVEAELSKLKIKNLVWTDDGKPGECHNFNIEIRTKKEE